MSQINLDDIKKQIQIITKDSNNYVLYKDYQQLLQQIQKNNTKQSSLDSQNSQKQIEFIDVEEEQQKIQHEMNYYKKKFQQSSQTFEKQQEQIVKLQESCNELKNLYLVTLQEKQKIQKQVQQLTEQRDYAEGELIKKALQFSKHQDDLNLKIVNLQKQQNLFDKEKKEFLQLKNDYIQQTLKNPNIKRKSTFDFQPQKDEFLEVKMILKRQQGIMIHPENNKNQKSYYNIMSCDIDSSQRYLATTGMDKRILISDISKNFLPVCEFQSKYIQNVSCFDDKRGILITGGQNNDISFYSIKNQKKKGTFKNHQDQINVLKVTENNSLISGSQDRTIKTWDLKKMRLLGSKMFPSVTLCLDVNSNMIFSGHQDGTLKINSQNTNKSIYQSNLFENGFLNFCEYYPTTNSLLISSRNRLIKIFDLRMMSVMKEFSLQNFEIFDGPKKRFAADYNLQNLYCGTNSGELKEFDISGQILNLKKTVKVTDQPINIPYIIHANLHDSIFGLDFDGRITTIRFISEFGQFNLFLLLINNILRCILIYKQQNVCYKQFSFFFHQKCLKFRIILYKIFQLRTQNNIKLILIILYLQIIILCYIINCFILLDIYFIKQKHLKYLLKFYIQLEIFFLQLTLIIFLFLIQ